MKKIIALAGGITLLASPALAALSVPAPGADANSSMMGKAGVIAESPIVLYTDPFPQSVPVPEPATWALLIAGFGLVGAAARRQHRKLAHRSN